jgi:hypothetical protein
MQQKWRQFILVDPVSRNIVGTGTRYGDAPIESCIVAEVVANHIENWYDANGNVQQYTLDQRLLRDNPPPYDAEWDNGAMQWVDKRTLDDLKTDLVAQVGARRDELQNSAWQWDDGQGTQHPMRGGDVFRSDITQAVALSDKLQQFSQPSTLPIKCADGQWRSYTNAQLAQIAMAYAQRWFTFSQTATAKQAAVMAATTKADATAAAAW